MLRKKADMTRTLVQKPVPSCVHLHHELYSITKKRTQCRGIAMYSPCKIRLAFGQSVAIRMAYFLRTAAGA